MAAPARALLDSQRPLLVQCLGAWAWAVASAQLRLGPWRRLLALGLLLVMALVKLLLATWVLTMPFFSRIVGDYQSSSSICVASGSPSRRWAALLPLQSLLYLQCRRRHGRLTVVSVVSVV